MVYREIPLITMFPMKTGKEPDVIFIVPYRDRIQYYHTFDPHMKEILTAQGENFLILYIHQCDTRSFNRGAMKNIGFIVVREMFPNTYLDKTLVFHDIDTMPIHKDVISNYKTTARVIKHFYGFRHLLGGIVAITAKDFSDINGFPNYWTWGYEDNELEYRARKNGLYVDRSLFYPVDSDSIVQRSSSNERIVNMEEFKRYAQKIPEGIHTITNLSYRIRSDSLETKAIEGGDFMSMFIDVYQFQTGFEHNPKYDRVFVITKEKQRPPFQTGYSSRKNCRMNIVLT